MTQQEFRTITARSQTLLNRSEQINIEFKESLAGLKDTALVAFANSAEGGTILIGVREIEIEDGRQRGEVVGVEVSDNAKLQIVNRASSCIPPIELEVFIENTDDKPFFRIEIPSGKHKPYCTGGGRYAIRGNARTNVLMPNQLLNIFMENESQQFFQRFQQVTGELEAHLNTLGEKVSALESRVDKNLSLARIEAKLDQLLEVRHSRFSGQADD
jgi:predicted HTH transcriptional regulator